MTRDAGIVRIAVASDDDEGLDGIVGAHFGRCPAYTIAELAGDEIRSHRVVANPYLDQHFPGVMPEFLASLEPDVVLAGGMGPRAVAMLAGFGIQVATGVRGTVREAIEAWLDGTRGVTPCQHDHPDSCGGHGD